MSKKERLARALKEIRSLPDAYYDALMTKLGLSTARNGSKSSGSSLHNIIMNIKANPNAFFSEPERIAYLEGHRDARHDAAEAIAEVGMGKRSNKLLVLDAALLFSSLDEKLLLEQIKKINDPENYSQERFERLTRLYGRARTRLTRRELHLTQNRDG